MDDIEWFVMAILFSLGVVSTLLTIYFSQKKEILNLHLKILDLQQFLESPWTSVAVRTPEKHGFIEVLAPDGSMQNGLMSKIVMFNGSVGGIKFWRPLKEGK